ncbi:unnamed protein product [Cuscuta epithymum]|uniref:Uncharacterized protein n=1 Tax=Cuscuta epithymum TaxID=186058 RepID=A0AAV0DMB4_9ASTE|nr:unnamed protein product [Cuscuta epithymum]
MAGLWPSPTLPPPIKIPRSLRPQSLLPFHPKKPLQATQNTPHSPRQPPLPRRRKSATGSRVFNGHSTPKSPVPEDRLRPSSNPIAPFSGNHNPNSRLDRL